MSDWNRSGRDNDQSRFGGASREDRDFSSQERWRSQGQRGGDERRSFEERHPDPARGGFTGMSFGEADFMPQDQGGRDFRGQHYGPAGPGGYRGQSPGSSGMQDARWPGSQESRNRTYGPEGRPQDWGHSPYADDHHHGMGGRQDFGGGRSFQQQQHRQGGQQSYGQGAGGVGVNPALQRIADGETDHGLRANLGLGQHRGRGPKNYTRSDERIREDVNDRLSDDSWLDASEVEVQVSSCEVTLTGTVQSREDKRRAEDLAEQVSGVKHVQNNLRVQSQSAQTTRDASTNTGGGTFPSVT